MKKIKKIITIFILPIFLFVNIVAAQSDTTNGCISQNKTYQILCLFFQQYQKKPTSQFVATPTQQMIQPASQSTQQNFLGVLPSLLSSVRFGSNGNQNQNSQTQNQSGPMAQSTYTPTSNSPTNNQDVLQTYPNLKPGDIVKSGSCVAFGDSLGYGMSLYGEKKAICKYYTTTGLADAFNKGNESKSYLNFKSQVEQALNDPNVRLIVWELGTNGTCPTCNAQQDGAAKFYQTLATQAVQKGKLLILPVYNNKMSKNTDAMAKALGDEYKKNIIVLDYTKISDCVRGTNQDVHYTGACYSKLSKLRGEVINKTLETKKEEKNTPTS